MNLFFNEVVDYTKQRDELTQELSKIMELVKPIQQRLVDLDNLAEKQLNSQKKIIEQLKIIETQLNSTMKSRNPGVAELKIVYESSVKEIHIYEGSNLVDGFKIVKISTPTGTAARWEQTDDIKRTLLSTRELHLAYGKTVEFLYTALDNMLKMEV